jgi:CubicO group peptidase (beta-lactamase class C family)
VQAFTQADEVVPTFDGSPREQRRAFAGWLLQQQPAGAPGSYLYSNAGYAIAAAMAEEKMGTSFEQLITEQLFEPLRISSSGFGWPALSASEQPWGHRGREDSYEPHPPHDAYQIEDIFNPAGNIHLTIVDLARFAALHLRGLRGEAVLLEPTTFAQLHTDTDGRAVGWNIQQFRGTRASTHLGSTGTFFAAVLIAPERDRAVVAVANAGGAAAQDAVFTALSQMYRKYEAQE